MSENKRIYKIEAVPVREETLPPSATNPEYTHGAYGYDITIEVSNKQQTCPRCGAAQFNDGRNLPFYECDTDLAQGSQRTPTCYEREIEKLKAEIALLYAVKSAMFEQLKANQT
jgi:hypothetical protein